MISTLMNIKILTVKVFIVVMLSVGLMGCIVQANFESRYDPACNIEKRHVTLSVKQVAKFGARNCRGEHACKVQLMTQLVGASIVLPVSAVVSGSIALIGNTLFWLQESDC